MKWWNGNELIQRLIAKKPGRTRWWESTYSKAARKIFCFNDRTNPRLKVILNRFVVCRCFFVILGASLTFLLHMSILMTSYFHFWLLGNRGFFGYCFSSQSIFFAFLPHTWKSGNNHFLNYLALEKGHLA